MWRGLNEHIRMCRQWGSGIAVIASAWPIIIPLGRWRWRFKRSPSTKPRPQKHRHMHSVWLENFLAELWLTEQPPMMTDFINMVMEKVWQWLNYYNLRRRVFQRKLTTSTKKLQNAHLVVMWITLNSIRLLRRPTRAACVRSVSMGFVRPGIPLWGQLLRPMLGPQTGWLRHRKDPAVKVEVTKISATVTVKK